MKFWTILDRQRVKLYTLHANGMLEKLDEHTPYPYYLSNLSPNHLSPGCYSSLPLSISEAELFFCSSKNSIVVRCTVSPQDMHKYCAYYCINSNCWYNLPDGQFFEYLYGEEIAERVLMGR